MVLLFDWGGQTHDHASTAGEVGKICLSRYLVHVNSKISDW